MSFRPTSSPSENPLIVECEAKISASIPQSPLHLLQLYYTLHSSPPSNTSSSVTCGPCTQLCHLRWTCWSNPRAISTLFFILRGFTHKGSPWGSMGLCSTSSFHNLSPSLGNYWVSVHACLYCMMGHPLSSTKNLYCLSFEWPTSCFLFIPM